MNENDLHFKRAEIVQHTQRLLDSYKHWTGAELAAREGSAEAQAENLYRAPFVVVSHATQSDPILNYANAIALTLWEMDWQTFTSTPSRMTAETAQLQEERARFMKEALEKGFVRNYRGIRISRTGKRFWIENATIWTVRDEQGNRCGQAATFKEWRFLQE